MRKRPVLSYLACLLLALASKQVLAGCGSNGLAVQVLGSGGPEVKGRASSAYLVWQDGRARVLVDMGSGSLLRFEQAGASIEDLEVVLLSHLHVDHSADLPSLVKASYFSPRNKDLPVYGPVANRLMPATSEFIEKLFSPRGAYRYLADYLDGSESYRLLAHDVQVQGKQPVSYSLADMRLSAVAVHHGPIPALAWRVEISGHRVVFSGDMSNQYQVLSQLAEQADLLVAHHAIAEQANPVARNLHMPPSVIGQVAAQARVRQLVLSHRMQRTLGQEKQSEAYIRQAYHGPLDFAEDLDCYPL